MRLPHYSAVPRTFPFSNVPSRPFSNTKTLLVSLVPESSPIFPCHSSNHRSKTRTLSPTERPLEPNLENPGQDSLHSFTGRLGGMERGIAYGNRRISLVCKGLMTE